MVKFSNFIATLFNKNASSKLETDAAPMQPRAKTDTYQAEATANVNTGASENGNLQNGNQNESLATENLAMVPSSSQQPLQPVPSEHRNPAQTIVNNVQHNVMSAPQTSISNASGMQVYQIRNANNLHIGNSFTFNAPTREEYPSTSGLSPGASNVRWANLRLSNTISRMMQCQDEVDPEVIDTVSRHLGYEWKSFARKLGYSEGQIDAFEADNSTLSEQIYAFILDWVRNDDEPTVGRLVTLLWTNKHKETVYYVKQVWKTRKEDSISRQSS